MRTLTKLILKEATSAAAASSTAAVSVAAAASGGAGANGSASPDDEVSGGGGASSSSTQSSSASAPKQWTNTLSFLLRGTFGLGGGGSHQAQANAAEVGGEAAATNSNSSAPRREGGAEVEGELLMGMACISKPILAAPSALPSAAPTTARLPTSVPPAPTPSGPLPKAPTGSGGHVLYPENAHKGAVKAALSDIFGPTGADDRLLPSLMYDINWSYVRVVGSDKKLSPPSLIANSNRNGTSNDAANSANTNGVSATTAGGGSGSGGASRAGKGGKGKHGGKASVVRKADGTVVVNSPATSTKCVLSSSSSSQKKKETVTEYLFSRYVPSTLDAQSQQWLRGKAVPSVPRGAASAWLQTFMSRTSANALTGRGEMFVVSRAQVVALLRKYDETVAAERAAASASAAEAADEKEEGSVDAAADEKPKKASASPSVPAPAPAAAPSPLYYNNLRIPTLIDIGAGDGGATYEYAHHLFGVMAATEDNKAMQWRLWWRGFRVLDFPSCVANSQIYSDLMRRGRAGAAKAAAAAAVNGSKVRAIKDSSASPAATASPSSPRPPASASVTTVIALMNVLDRADKPVSLLGGVIDCMRRIDEGVAEGEGGATTAPKQKATAEEEDDEDPKALFMMAVVLPWCPFVETKTKKLPPSEPLPMAGAKCQERAHFETSLAALVARVIVPMGLEVVAWTRVPYLCEGSGTHGYYRLDDAVLLMRRRRAKDAEIIA